MGAKLFKNRLQFVVKVLKKLFNVVKVVFSFQHFLFVKLKYILILRRKKKLHENLNVPQNESAQRVYRIAHNIKLIQKMRLPLVAYSYGAAAGSTSNANIDFPQSDRKKIAVLCKLFFPPRLPPPLSYFGNCGAIFRLDSEALNRVHPPCTFENVPRWIWFGKHFEFFHINVRKSTRIFIYPARIRTRDSGSKVNWKILGTELLLTKKKRAPFLSQKMCVLIIRETFFSRGRTRAINRSE